MQRCSLHSSWVMHRVANSATRPQPHYACLPADILGLVGLKSFRVAAVLLMGLLAYGELQLAIRFGLTSSHS